MSQIIYIIISKISLFTQPVREYNRVFYVRKNMSTWEIFTHYTTIASAVILLLIVLVLVIFIYSYTAKSLGYNYIVVDTSLNHVSHIKEPSLILSRMDNNRPASPGWPVNPASDLATTNANPPQFTTWNVARELADLSARGFTITDHLRARIQLRYDRYDAAMNTDINPINSRNLTDQQYHAYTSQTEVVEGVTLPVYVEHPITQNIVLRSTVYAHDVHGNLIPIRYPGGRPPVGEDE